MGIPNTPTLLYPNAKWYKYKKLMTQFKMQNHLKQITKTKQKNVLQHILATHPVQNPSFKIVFQFLIP